MNRRMLSKMQFKRVKVRPLARRFDKNGRELERLDDVWIIIPNPPGDKITLRNTSTDHILEIGTDHIREYMTDPGGTDGFLKLKSQIIILQGRGVFVEPLAWSQQI